MITRKYSAASTPVDESARPTVRGKFLFVGDEKFYVRGVTYGTFRPDDENNLYHDPDLVERDLARMAELGFNAVRTYTVPPRWLLDIARRHDLYVMVGLPWEQHVAFLDDQNRGRAIEERVRANVRACAGHPAVLCYAIGNEIPAPIVRWHGARRIERYLQRIYEAAKAEDPAGLVTYVNYPSTEYLRLPFLDFACFNVYLESQHQLDAYLARLQNIAADRPLLMAEIGLDSRSKGEDVQARSLDWQIRTIFSAGCAGAFVFSWTDEWYRGGQDIDDWDFGLTDRDRHPKPALGAVVEAFAETPLPPNLSWPRISVIVCSCNGARTIEDCCNGLRQLDYPNFEVIVVDDGSTDRTGAIAREHGFRVIRTTNRGLSSARNAGLEVATGEIVAYIDDDARPDPQWLTYLASTFMRTTHAGAGGPSIAPPGDGQIADCVANAPGNPTHVLLSDHEAEHIPGCNMAFRKAALEAVGGFDPQFRAAGDDVDVCWRLQERGWTLGFNPAAMVWHHRRSSIRAYWKQQTGYGKAEALLEQKWPEKYNVLGHLAWGGRLYGQGLTLPLPLRKSRVYQGRWGSALFQSVYEPATGTLRSIPLMPDWYLVIALLAALSALSPLWLPLLLAIPLLILAIAALLIQAGVSASHGQFTSGSNSTMSRLKLWSLTAFLHVLQPLARLRGRVLHGLSPWRQRGITDLALPWMRHSSIWRETWQAPEAWLGALEATLRRSGAVVLHGGDYDRWDLEVRGGTFGTARLLMAIEEHGAGKQLARFRFWPRPWAVAQIVTLVFASLAAGAALGHAWTASAILALTAILLVGRMLYDSAAGIAAISDALAQMESFTIDQGPEAIDQ
jgi:GT2 family glycosyltransferase